MKKNETWFLVFFAVISVLIFAVAVGLKDRAGSGASGQSSGGVGQGGDNANSRKVGDPLPDSVVISPLPNGDEVVADTSVGYYFSSVPANWYVEKGVGAGLMVYPDYDPKSGAAPTCKIEVSNLAIGSSSIVTKDPIDLNFWITDHLYADPTANVTEISRTPIAISGTGDGSATSSAIEWYGTLNGVTTTLVYAEMSKSVIELVPSTLASAGDDANNDDCGLALQALTSNLHFGNYEP